MEPYRVHLRYFVGDPLTDIRRKDLEAIGRACGVDITFQRIDNRVPADGMMREETLEKAIEDITQDVITVSARDESGLRGAISAIYDKFRSPRTPYGFWGSDAEGKRIAREIADRTGGGW